MTKCVLLLLHAHDVFRNGLLLHVYTRVQITAKLSYTPGKLCNAHAYMCGMNTRTESRPPNSELLPPPLGTTYITMKQKHSYNIMFSVKARPECALHVA